MNEKLDIFKDGFSSIVELCNDIDSSSFQDSVAAIWDEVQELEGEDDLEIGLSLLDELMVHVNDLDEEFLEPFSETINDIVRTADELRDEVGSA